MKILALNLPQYHEIKENNEWWGKGFTDWTNVRKAQPVYPGHIQPITPLNNNYYDLSKRDAVVNQAIMAHENGVSGFVYFHYWYNGRKLLETPCEVLLESPEAPIEYCFCWANHPWTRSWDGKEHQILLQQTYGGKDDWENHLRYLLNFFKDERYIKVHNKPMFFVYAMQNIPNYNSMIEYWNKRLIEEGYAGIYLVEYISTKNPKVFSKYTAAVYEDEPIYSARFKISLPEKIIRFLNKKISRPDILDYDEIWRYILQKQATYEGRKIIRGAFATWDNTPRRGKNGCTIFKGASPEKFEYYFKELLYTNRKYASSDYIVFNAWNEWGEGAMLEPTAQYGYAYLNILNKILKEYNKELDK
jgi:hypothetical protein